MKSGNPAAAAGPFARDAAAPPPARSAMLSMPQKQEAPWAAGFSGPLSMECEGQGGPMIERSLAWLRNTLRELNIPFDR